MISRRLILHVGLPKTGTTAIQNYLWHHREELADQGITAPADTSGHARNDEGVLQGSAQIDALRHFCRSRDQITAAATDWASIIDALSRSSADQTVVISHESLSHRSHALRPEAFSAIPANIEQFALIYLRQPVEYLSSFALQMLMSRQAEPKKVAQAIRGRLRRYFSGGFRNVLDHFEAQIALRVHSYDDASADIVEDFCAATGIPDLQAERVVRANVKTFGRDTALTLHALREVSVSDTALHKHYWNTKLVPLAREIDDSPREFFTEDTLESIMSVWRKEREHIQDQYEISLKETASICPAPSVLQAGTHFAEALIALAEPRMNAREFDALRRGLDRAVSGYYAPGLSDSALKPAEASRAVTLSGTGEGDRPELAKPKRPGLVRRLARAWWSAAQLAEEPELDSAQLRLAWLAQDNPSTGAAKRLLREMEAAGLNLRKRP